MPEKSRDKFRDIIATTAFYCIWQCAVGEQYIRLALKTFFVNFINTNIIEMIFNSKKLTEQQVRSIVGAKIPRGKMLYVIAVRAENHPVYVPVVIIRDEEKQNFMMVKSIFGRANAIKTFYKLESAKQEAILSQLGTNHYNRFESDEDIVFQTRQELVLKYALTKETYTPDTQRAIEGMFKDKEISKHKVDQRLQYLFRIASSCEKRIPVKAGPFEKKLNEKFYKMDKAKKQIKDLFCSIERAEKKGCNVLFVGEPGVGKTSLMMAIAEAMNLPFECMCSKCMYLPICKGGCLMNNQYEHKECNICVRSVRGGKPNLFVCRSCYSVFCS